ncbi:MAG: CrcB family protein [Candidatus Eisenbacteria bacterium]
MRVLLIGFFGLAGTLARYGLQGAAQRFSGSTFPYGTLAVNVIGSFLVGFVAAVTLERVMVPANLRAAVLIGFCGGFTTYSAFAWETLVLARDGNPIGAIANIAAQVVLGLAAVWAGYTVAIRL